MCDDIRDDLPGCLDDFERHAAKTMPDFSWGFYETGSDDNLTRDRNKQKLNQILLKPKYMQKDMSNINMDVTLVGNTKISSPIGLSPTGIHVLAHQGGELETVQAAMTEDIVMTLSSWSNFPMEEVAEKGRQFASSDTGDGPNLWFNTYLYPNLQHTNRLIEQAYQNGYKAVAITCDICAVAKRRGHWGSKQTRLWEATKDLRWPPHIPQKGGKEYWQADPAATWEIFGQVVRRSKLPIIAKGIMTAEDATLALQHGAAAIWVSNHGGRQLDSQPASIEVLPLVLKAVTGRVDVYIDGGFRTGNDVFKALALGARAVFIGRPIIWGLKYDGAKGAGRVLRLLKDELRTTMALTGCTSVMDIDSTFIYDELMIKSKV